MNLNSITTKKEKNRVLFVNHSLYPYENSGTPISTLNHAIGIKGKGAEVAVLIPFAGTSENYTKESFCNFTLFKVPMLEKDFAYLGAISRIELNKYLSSITKILEDFKPKIIHINDYVYMPTEVINLFSKTNAYIIRNVCNFEELCYFDGLTYFDGQKYVLCSGPETANKCAECFINKARILDKQPFNKDAETIIKYKTKERFEAVKLFYKNRVNGVIFTAETFKEFFTKFIDVLEEIIKINPRGFDFDTPRRTTPKKNDNKIVNIGFFGTLVMRKGIDTLLDAFNKITDIDNFILKIYSSNDNNVYRYKIKELEEKYPEKIKFCGSYRVEELPQITEIIDFAIVPSIFETFNRVVRELMYFGIPLIVTDFFGSFIVKNNVNGIKIKIGDSQALAEAIKNLLLNHKQIEKFSQGVIDTKIDSLEDEINGIYSFYEDIINENISPKTLPEKVTVIIPVYNNWEYTKQTLASLAEQKKLLIQYIIINNASTDETSAELKKYSNIKVIENKENLGFPKAVNQALRLAEGDYVLISNNDVILSPNAINKMVSIFNTDSQIGIVSGISNSVSGVQLDKNAQYQTVEEMQTYMSEISEKNRDKTIEFPRVAFLCTLIKKEVIQKLGALDERFHPGNLEDDDYCLRTQLAGYKSIIALDVFIHHYGSKSFKAEGEKKFFDLIEHNRKIFVEKWGADPNQIWLENKKIKKRNINIPFDEDPGTEKYKRAYSLILEEDYFWAKKYLKETIEIIKSNNPKKIKVELVQELIDKISLL